MKTMKILAALVVATVVNVQDVKAKVTMNKTIACGILTLAAGAVAGATEYKVRSAKKRNVSVSDVISKVNTGAKIATGVFGVMTTLGVSHHVAKRSNVALARLVKQDKNLWDSSVSRFVGSAAATDRATDLADRKRKALAELSAAGSTVTDIASAEAAIEAAKSAVTHASGDTAKAAQKKVDALQAAAKLSKKIAAFNEATGMSV